MMLDNFSGPSYERARLLQYSPPTHGCDCKIGNREGRLNPRMAGIAETLVYGCPRSALVVRCCNLFRCFGCPLLRVHLKANRKAQNGCSCPKGASLTSMAGQSAMKESRVFYGQNA